MARDIIAFKCGRLQIELNKFIRSKTIPSSFLDGIWTVEDLEDCVGCFKTQRQEVAAKKLINAYNKYIETNLVQIEETISREYMAIMENMHTNDPDFRFPTIMSRYRPNMNPVRAIFYDTREVVNTYNTNDPRHTWLVDLVRDPEFNNRLIEALSADMRRLNKILMRYYLVVSQKTDEIPLELFHARHQLADFRVYYQFFTDINSWDLD